MKKRKGGVVISNTDQRVPVNTAQQNPLKMLAEALVFGPSEAIERQEAGGQSSFVGSDTLPTDMEPLETKSVLERLGVRFLGEVPDDSIFQYVELPAGWKKVLTAEPRLSMLVNADGRERARIFYKAAFYDRRATLLLETRYTYRDILNRSAFDGTLLNDTEPIVALVTDGCGEGVGEERILWTSEEFDPPQERLERFRAWHVARKQAEAWLDENFPQWRDPLAYWDE